jgi:drug/metabolite transporter (DMT)-like permease
VAGIGGIINGTVPLFTAALTALPFSPYHDRKQRLGWKVVVGLLSGFIGLLIIFSPSLRESGAKNDLWAVIAIVGMSICYSLSNVMNARILAPPHKISITGNVFHQHAASLVFLTALVPLLKPVSFDYSQVLAPRVLTSLLFLGIISGATSLLIYYYLIREIGAVKTSAITYLIPIGAVILDLLILGTEPHWTAIAGAAFILVGVLSIRRAPRSG